MESWMISFLSAFTSAASFLLEETHRASPRLHLHLLRLSPALLALTQEQAWTCDHGNLHTTEILGFIYQHSHHTGKRAEAS